MATKKVDTSGLRDLVNQYFDEFGREAYEALEGACEETAKQVVKELKKGGGYNTDETGKRFNRGWKATKEMSRLRSSKTYIGNTIVHNENIPGLAHLLEFGHAKRNGGRTRAFTFIAPIADSVEQKFDAAFKRRFGG